MKTLTILSILILAFACTEFDVQPEYRIAKQAQPYVDEFFKEASLRGIKLSKDNLVVIFDDTNNNGVDAFKPGTFKPGTQKTILLDQWTFDTQHPIQNKLIIFHELGHALLNLPHDDSHECIMNTAPNIYLLEGDQQSLLDDLFKLRKQL